MLKLRIPLRRLHKFAKLVRMIGRFTDKNCPPYPHLFLIYFQSTWNMIQKDESIRKRFVEEVSLLAKEYKKLARKSKKDI